jgi:hypothetical protein
MKTALLILIALLVPANVHAADPTSEQIAACLSDALKYCRADTVDRAEIRACLVKHKKQLSPSCRGVFQDMSMFDQVPDLAIENYLRDVLAVHRPSALISCCSAVRP